VVRLYPASSKDLKVGMETMHLDKHKFKKKFDPIAAPSLVKTERAFRQSKLEKGENPEI
jgi:hypothetical protein